MLKTINGPEPEFLVAPELPLVSTAEAGDAKSGAGSLHVPLLRRLGSFLR